MPKYNIGLSADKKTVYVAVEPEALPAEATLALTDIEHGTVNDKVDPVPANAGNHVLYHDVQDRLYHEGIFDMQRISIVKYGNIWGQTGLTIAPVPNLDVSNGDTSALVIEYAPSGEVATNAHFTYASSDPTKATVNAAGLVTAVAAGTTTITVTQANSGLSATVPITVVA